ncbi:MAG: hypothetical protein AB7P99_06900 [Vicinamibacterales bacterium]
MTAPWYEDCPPHRAAEALLADPRFDEKLHEPLVAAIGGELHPQKLDELLVAWAAAVRDRAAAQAAVDTFGDGVPAGREIREARVHARKILMEFTQEEADAFAALLTVVEHMATDEWRREQDAIRRALADVAVRWVTSVYEPTLQNVVDAMDALDNALVGFHSVRKPLATETVNLVRKLGAGGPDRLGRALDSVLPAIHGSDSAVADALKQRLEDLWELFVTGERPKHARVPAHEFDFTSRRAGLPPLPSLEWAMPRAGKRVADRLRQLIGLKP